MRVDWLTGTDRLDDARARVNFWCSSRQCELIRLATGHSGHCSLFWQARFLLVRPTILSCSSFVSWCVAKSCQLNWPQIMAQAPKLPWSLITMAFKQHSAWLASIRVVRVCQRGAQFCWPRTEVNTAVNCQWIANVTGEWSHVAQCQQHRQCQADCIFSPMHSHYLPWVFCICYYSTNFGHLYSHTHTSE